MSSLARPRVITFDEFCASIQAGQKADLIDGVIYMASPDNIDANNLFMWLGGLMYSYVQAKQLGMVNGSRVAYKLNEINSPEPDIAFLRASRHAAVQRGHIKGAPDVAVEIVSPDSIERDYERKRQQYETAGVREYWIIDEIKKKCLFLRLKKGKFQEVRVRGGVFRSQVIAGFWFEPAWLWQTPIPNLIETSQQVLAGPSNE